MQKTKQILVNIGILIAVLIISLLFLEIVFRFLHVCKIAPSKSGNLFTFFRKVGNPQLVFELKPNSKGYLIGKQVKINSQGMRDYEYSLEKPDDVYRIAVIGDSITFGWGVELNESYPKILEKKLNSSRKVEVLNFGVPGYVGVQVLTVIKEKALRYNPDLIIIGHYLSMPNKIWNLYDTSVHIPIGVKIFLNEHSCLYNWAKTRWTTILLKAGVIERTPYQELYIEGSEPWENYKISIKNISEISKEKNIPVLFVLLPNWDNLNDNYEFKEVDELMNKTVSENGLLCLDIFPEVKGLNAGEYRVDYVHPNGKGQEIIAYAIYKYLNNSFFATTKNL